MKGKTMNRIQQEPEAYALAKQEWLVNRNKNFKPYYEWFHRKKETLSTRMVTISNRLKGFHQMKDPETGRRYRYEKMADMLGCSTATVGDIINRKRTISDEMFETIDKNLKELGL